MLTLILSVTLVSILRLNSLIHFASTENLTCEYQSINYEFTERY
jgi:hypothetical protein